jgi:DNA ligase (NAD+)
MPVCRPLKDPKAKQIVTALITSAQVQGRMQHFVSRNAMDIEGLGYSILDKFTELGFLHDVTDIYSLSKYEKELKVLRAWEKALIFLPPLKLQERPLIGLFAGIRHVGDRTANSCQTI